MQNKTYPIDSEHIDTLMKRFIYLNQLRVGVISVFLAIVAALFAVWRGMDPGNQKPLLQVIPSILLITGILVYVFDLRCRARASRTAQGIRARARGLKSYKIKKFALKDYFGIDEDTIFSMIVMLINSGLSVVIISTFTKASAIMAFVLAMLIFMLYIMIYNISWRRLVLSSVDEWPDDDLLDKNSS